MKALVLIGDIDYSRKLDNGTRAQAQAALSRVFAELNEMPSKNGLLTPIELTLGDEFQAIFSSPRAFLTLMAKIDLAVPDATISYSFALGDISTAIDPTSSLRSDGPAWWTARDNLKTIKESRRHKVRGYSPIRIGGFSAPELDEAANAILLLDYEVRSRWTKKRKELLLTLQAHFDFKDEKTFQTELLNYFIETKGETMALPNFNNILRKTHFFDHVDGLLLIQSWIEKELTNEETDC
jgi:hypothetical protein